MKITQTSPGEGCAWAITHCDCRDTEKNSGVWNELQSEDGKIWYCPNCRQTTAEIFCHVKDKEQYKA